MLKRTEYKKQVYTLHCIWCSVLTSLQDFALNVDKGCVVIVEVHSAVALVQI